MSVIMHNILAMNADRQFGINTKNKAKNTEKLSSGYKINRAADDAAGLSISEKLRNQIRNLNQATRNVEDGMYLTNTADSVLQEVHNIFHRQRELLVKAANDVNTADDRQAIEDELVQLSEETDKIFEKTQYNGRYLFKGKDEIISGPTVTAPAVPDVTNQVTTSITNTTTKWLPKNPAPDVSTRTVSNQITDIYVGRSTNYFEEETVASVDDWDRVTYNQHSCYDVMNTTKDVNVTTTTSYERINDSRYTALRSPADMTGDYGYINVKNVAGDLNLSCAMSQLGVKIDGVEKTLDLYNGGAQSVSTDKSNPNKAITTYNFGNGLALKQTIELSDNKYVISYAVENNGSESHTLDVRLAFDTMNTEVTSVKDGSTKNFALESDFARIPVNASNADNAVLGNIEQLYGTWGDENVTDGETVSHHTGVGAWWNNKEVASGGTINIGSLTYGPIELLKDPYYETVTTDTVTDYVTKTNRVDTVLTYKPEYLMIQDGANAGEHFPIRLYNLDTDKLKCKVPNPVSAFNASDSLQHMDRVNQTISNIRSYYGAMTNRMETAYNANMNYAENLDSAESNIRDTDMSTEMVALSKNNILEQAAQSMLAQANQQKQGILQLIEGR